MINNRITFSKNEYLEAAKERYADALIQDNSFAIRCYLFGVAIESILKSDATKFDGKHDLEKLLNKSNINTRLDFEQRMEIAGAVKSLRFVWNNNLRYVGDKRIDRAIASFNASHSKKANYNFQEVHKNMESLLNKTTKLLLEASEL